VTRDIKIWSDDMEWEIGNSNQPITFTKNLSTSAKGERHKFGRLITTSHGVRDHSSGRKNRKFFYSVKIGLHFLKMQWANPRRST